MILRNATLIDGSGAAPIPNSTVTIAEGIIVSAGPSSSGRPPQRENDVLDLTGHTVLPGFVDSHVHLVFSGGADPLGDIMRENDQQLLARATRNAQAALLAGLTLVRDCGSRGTVLHNLRDAVAAGDIVGPRILVSGAPITSPAGHLHFMGGEVRGVDAITAATTRLLDAGADFIKVMASGGGMTPGSDMRQPQFSETELLAIATTTHGRGRHVAAHSHSAEATIRTVAAGIDTIEHCSWLGQDGEEAYDEGLVSQMVRQGSILSPAVGVRFRSTPEQITQDARAQASLRKFQEIRFQTTRRMIKAGVPIIVGTDAGVQHTPCGEFGLVFSIFIDRFGLTPMEAIVAATSRPAAVFGLANEVGTIKPGMRADLVVLQGDPLTDTAAFRRVQFVFRNGKKVVQRGKLIENARR